MTFGSSPTSTTTISGTPLTFPVSAVYVPGIAGSVFTAMQGGPVSTDGNGNQSAPIAVYIADGSDVAQGHSTDAANVNTVIGQLKQIQSNTASVTLTSLPAGTNTIGNVGLVGGSAAIGTVTANQGGAPWSNNVTQFGSTNLSTGTGASGAGIPRVTVSNDSTMGSNAPTGSAVPANAFYAGGDASTSLPSAATAGNLVGAMYDKFGRTVMLLNAMRDLVSPITQLTLTSTTTETTLIAAVASTFLDIVSLVVINTSNTSTQVDFRDSTSGTIRLSLYVPAGDMRGVALPVPLPQSAVNQNWTAKCGSSVASIIITGSYIANK